MVFLGASLTACTSMGLTIMARVAGSTEIEQDLPEEEGIQPHLSPVEGLCHVEDVADVVGEDRDRKPSCRTRRS
jgi:hypothetical protein